MTSMRVCLLVCALSWGCSTTSRPTPPDARGGSGGSDQTGGAGGSGTGGFGGTFGVGGNSGSGGSGGSGGTGGSAGSGGSSGSGGSGGSGGSLGIPDGGPDAPSDAGVDDGGGEDGSNDAAVDGGEDAADGNLDVGPGIDAPEGGAAVDVVSDAGEGLTVLYVTGIGALVASDVALIDRLTGRGYTVVVKTDMDAVAADLNGKAAIFLSASTVAGRVMTSLAGLPTLATPVVAMDENLEPFLNLTAAAATDHAATNNQTQVAIVAGADPALTGGLTGNVTVYAAPFAVGWGIPGAGAVKVATIVGTAAHVAVYVYPQGAMMANGQTAPAKRAFYFVRDTNLAPLNAPGLITEDALELFDGVTDFLTH